MVQLMWKQLTLGAVCSKPGHLLPPAETRASKSVPALHVKLNMYVYVSKNSKEKQPA
jgi:hypothetical protein